MVGLHEHPISTEHGQTPLQLWISGLMEIAGTDHSVANEIFTEVNL